MYSVRVGNERMRNCSSPGQNRGSCMGYMEHFDGTAVPLGICDKEGGMAGLMEQSRSKRMEI